MDRYIDKRGKHLYNRGKLSIDELKFILNPCTVCTRNLMRENCFETCRYYELWIALLEKGNLY